VGSGVTKYLSKVHAWWQVESCDPSCWPVRLTLF
jgi:hypothetical protein